MKYSETCIKRTPASVPNFYSHIYWTLLLSGRGHRNEADLSPKTCIERTVQEILQWIFVILLEDCAVLKLCRSPFNLVYNLIGPYAKGLR